MTRYISEVRAKLKVRRSSGIDFISRAIEVTKVFVPAIAVMIESVVGSFY